MTTIVETKQVSKVYQLGKTQVKALSNIDFKVSSGDFMAIVGPSGSGKTTLLNLIGCLDKPSSGSVKISGEDVSNLKPDQLAEIRNRKIGFIFQTFNLIPVLTAYENIEFPLLLLNIPVEERKELINSVLEVTGIKKQANQRPEELSGGQRQRVAIARALVKKPDIIMADEPTANLDSDTGEKIIKLMMNISQQRQTTFVFSTHDQMIMQHATKLVHLHDGKLEHDSGQVN